MTIDIPIADTNHLSVAGHYTGVKHRFNQFIVSLGLDPALVTYSLHRERDSSNNSLHRSNPLYVRCQIALDPDSSLTSLIALKWSGDGFRI